MQSKQHKAENHTPVTMEQLNRIHRKKWERYVRRGTITPQQAYTLAAMERFVEMIFVLGYIDFPRDEAAIHRVRSFMDAWLDHEASYDETIERSYLLDETEDFIFVVAGLRCGTEDSMEKDTLSAVFMTEQRFFIFDNKDDPGISSSHNANFPPLVAVSQAPLENINHIKLKRESALFPYGSFELSYQIPDRLLQHYRNVLERLLGRLDDPATNEKWRSKLRQFNGQQTYEMEIRGPDAHTALLALVPTLQNIGTQKGFTVTNEFEDVCK